MIDGGKFSNQGNQQNMPTLQINLPMNQITGMPGGMQQPGQFNSDEFFGQFQTANNNSQNQRKDQSNNLLQF